MNDLVSKADVIHHIAEQYIQHNELVPSWLTIGDMPAVQSKTEIENLKTEIEKPKSEMNDLISREDVITALIDADWIKTTAQQAVIAEVLNKIPSVKPKKGRWTRRRPSGCYSEYIMECSECKGLQRSKYNFCPNCGAEMSGGGEDGKDKDNN